MSGTPHHENSLKVCPRNSQLLWPVPRHAQTLESQLVPVRNLIRTFVFRPPRPFQKLLVEKGNTNRIDKQHHTIFK